MLTEIPKPNNTNFVSLEDTYIMNQAGGIFDTVEPMEVVVKCPHKRKRISALMSGNIKINASAEWESVFDNGIFALSSRLGGDIASTVSWSTGLSVKQPWMNKKQWKSTKPFTLDIPIAFVSNMGDPKSEVYDPCMALLSLLYPRQVGYSDVKEQYGQEVTNKLSIAGTDWNEGIDLGDMSSAIANEFASGASVLSDTLGGFVGACASSYNMMVTAKDEVGNEKGLVANASNAFKLYNIPGESITGSHGDKVSISIGPVFNLGSVYLEDVAIDFSKTLNPMGYPLGAKVTLKCSPVKACYCRTDGQLVIFDEFNDAYEDLNGLLEAGKKALESTVELGKTLIVNAFGVLKDTGETIVEIAKGGK